MARPAEFVYWYRFAWNAAIAVVAPFVAHAWFPDATPWVAALSGIALLGLGIAGWRRNRDAMLPKAH